MRDTTPSWERLVSVKQLTSRPSDRKREGLLYSLSHPKMTEQNPKPSDLTADKNFDFDMIFPLNTPSSSIPSLISGSP